MNFNSLMNVCWKQKADHFAWIPFSNMKHVRISFLSPILCCNMLCVRHFPLKITLSFTWPDYSTCANRIILIQIQTYIRVQYKKISVSCDDVVAMMIRANLSRNLYFTTHWWHGHKCSWTHSSGNILFVLNCLFLVCVMACKCGIMPKDKHSLRSTPGLLSFVWKMDK